MKNGLSYIVVITYNSSKTIINCLKSLLSLKYDRYRIIIVDNNSSDNTVNLINDNFKKEISIDKILLMRNSTNFGYAYAVNKGMKYAIGFDECKYLWILNSDIKVSNNCLDELLNNVCNDTIVF